MVNEFGASDEYVKAHDRTDVDAGSTAQHHTLGDGVNQAAPGKQTHDQIADLFTDQINHALTMGNHIGTDFAHLPVGTIISWAGSTAPVGWFICNGASLNRFTWAALYAVTGYSYGGAGTNYSLPNITNTTNLGYDIIKAA